MLSLPSCAHSPSALPPTSFHIPIRVSLWHPSILCPLLCCVGVLGRCFVSVSVSCRSVASESACTLFDTCVCACACVCVCACVYVCVCARARARACVRIYSDVYHYEKEAVAIECGLSSSQSGVRGALFLNATDGVPSTAYMRALTRACSAGRRRRRRRARAGGGWHACIHACMPRSMQGIAREPARNVKCTDRPDSLLVHASCHD